MKRSAILTPMAAVMLAAAATPAHAAGMPQLAFGNPLLLSQVIWGGFIFAAFYYAVSRHGLPRIDAILDMRAGVISGDLEQARLAKQRADQAVAELTEARRRAYADSQAALTAATQKAQADAAAQAEAATTRLDQQLAASEAQITAARDRAMASLHDVASDTAASIITRLTRLHPEPATISGAVDQRLRARGLAQLAQTPAPELVT
jgi:F-type H+-transporting ATPase subunit b